MSADSVPSRLQNDVVAALRRLRDVSHVQVEVVTQSGYSLDAVIVFRGNRIGVEVDGPSHYVGQTQSPNGATLLKRRQLRTLEGWTLVTIPYWEWYAIDTGSDKEKKEKKHVYIRNLLDEGVQ